jgi:predicted anti-sigma-YlaC factor YlaD
VDQFLMQYMAGELRGEVLRVFDDHLAECPTCRAYLDTYRRTIAIGKSAFVDENQPAADVIPEPFVKALAAAARASARPRQ